MKNDRTIYVRIPGGLVIKTSNRAKRMKISFSELIRKFIKAGLGL